MSELGAKMLVSTLEKLESGNYKREKQSDDFSVAPMLKKEMARIDWNKDDSAKIKNLVRGLNPFMGAFSFLNDKKIKFWKVKIIDEKFDEKPGTVIMADEKKGLIISTLDGAISVLEIQGENARKMPFSDYLRGNKILSGDIFK